ncbi:Hypothetical predicted protein, partial [Paramuricea clavata]
KFGEDDFDQESVSNVLESFVCEVYARNSNCRTFGELRWELFRTKNLESEKLPPTLGALTPHIQKANAISAINKGYRDPRPQTPLLTDNGWETISDGTISPKKCLEPPAPESVEVSLSSVDVVVSAVQLVVFATRITYPAHHFANVVTAATLVTLTYQIRMETLMNKQDRWTY